jgi:hypothetical protein
MLHLLSSWSKKPVRGQTEPSLHGQEELVRLQNVVRQRPASWARYPVRSTALRAECAATICVMPKMTLGNRTSVASTFRLTANLAGPGAVSKGAWRTW